MKTLVVALGGNALLQRGEALTAENQYRNIASAVPALARLARTYRLAIVHGNGPQVGLLSLQNLAWKEVEPYPLDVLVAETQGMIGYMLAQSLTAGVLKMIPGVKPFPSDANYVLLRMDNAGAAWEKLYERGVLVRDFSKAPYLENCLRVTVGASEENDAFLRALRDAVMGKCDLKVPST